MRARERGPSFTDRWGARVYDPKWIAMSIDYDASTDFTQRPDVPREIEDTADLMEQATGRRPAYEFDAASGEWLGISSADTGLWPEGFGYAFGPKTSCGGVSMMLAFDEQLGDEPATISMYLCVNGGGEARIRLDRDDAKLWAKLLKKAAKKVQS